MFSIRKRHKIQVLHRLDKEVSTTDIDLLRISRTKEQIQSTSQAVSNIIDRTPSEEVQKQINAYFPKRWETKNINHFFNNHPHVFGDLIHVIHTRRLENDEKWWHIPKEFLSNIQQIFLFRDRKHDIGTLIPEFVKVVCGQARFIEFASKQASILDINSYEFSQIPESPRRKSIRKLVISGLVSNISWCTEYNIDTYFWYTKFRILHYLNEIFWIDLSDIAYVQNIDQLTQKLSEFFKSGKWNDRKKSWKIIQAFHAWGDILNIEKDFASTMDLCDDVSKKLLTHWFILHWTISQSMNWQWVIIYSAKYKFNNQIIEVSWRAKSPKSMLKKLWETEEYVRSSAVRDELGISFVYADDTPQDAIVAIMQAWSLMLAHNGYILKNKWELDNEDTFRKVSTEIKKRPLFAEHKSWGDPKMKNASQSGFMSLWVGHKKQAIGCEIQYSKKSAKKWKEQDDPIYKFRGAIDALMRWAHQATPKEIFDAITREIQISDIPKFSDPDTGISLGLTTYNDIMQYLIEVKKILLPYFWKTRGKYILLFTTPKHRKEFEKRWKMEYLEKNKNSKQQKRYIEMAKVIEKLEQTH